MKNKSIFLAGVLFSLFISSADVGAYTPTPIPDIDYTELHRAADLCDVERERVSLDALPAQDRTETMNLVDREGCTPLAYAAKKGCMEIVKLLVESGAAVDRTDDQMRWTPLLRAAENQNTEVVEYLLKHGADVNHKAGYLGQTPLTEAIFGPYFGEDSKKDRHEIVRTMLVAGADVNLPGRSGLTPLMAAVFRSDTKLAQLLISKGANVLAKDEKNKTALDYANERGENKIANLLKYKK